MNEHEIDQLLSHVQVEPDAAFREPLRIRLLQIIALQHFSAGSSNGNGLRKHQPEPAPAPRQIAPWAWLATALSVFSIVGLFTIVLLNRPVLSPAALISDTGTEQTPVYVTVTPTPVPTATLAPTPTAAASLPDRQSVQEQVDQLSSRIISADFYWGVMREFDANPEEGGGGLLEWRRYGPEQFLVTTFYDLPGAWPQMQGEPIITASFNGLIERGLSGSFDPHQPNAMDGIERSMIGGGGGGGGGSGEIPPEPDTMVYSDALRISFEAGNVRAVIYTNLGEDQAIALANIIGDVARGVLTVEFGGGWDPADARIEYLGESFSFGGAASNLQFAPRQPAYLPEAAFIGDGFASFGNYIEATEDGGQLDLVFYLRSADRFVMVQQSMRPFEEFADALPTSVNSRPATRSDAPTCSILVDSGPPPADPNGPATQEEMTCAGGIEAYALTWFDGMLFMRVIVKNLPISEAYLIAEGLAAQAQ